MPTLQVADAQAPSLQQPTYNNLSEHDQNVLLRQLRARMPWPLQRCWWPLRFLRYSQPAIHPHKQLVIDLVRQHAARGRLLSNDVLVCIARGCILKPRAVVVIDRGPHFDTAIPLHCNFPATALRLHDFTIEY